MNSISDFCFSTYYLQPSITQYALSVMLINDVTNTSQKPISYYETSSPQVFTSTPQHNMSMTSKQWCTEMPKNTVCPK